MLYRQKFDSFIRIYEARTERTKCLTCDDRFFCTMCMVRNANENQDISAIGTLGDPLKINEHFCKVAALNRKIVLDWKSRLTEQRANA